MENRVIKEPASSEASLRNATGRLERTVRIAYLIAAAILLYALLLSAKVRAAETAAMARQHPGIAPATSQCERPPTLSC
jgi:hypothetical protein